MRSFPQFRQPDLKDCGPSCLKIVAQYHGQTISLEEIRNRTETTRSGSNLLNLADAAEGMGFRTLALRMSFEELSKEALMPCIVHWEGNHFVVVYQIKRGQVYVSDPSAGLVTYSSAEFMERWLGANATIEAQEGIALMLEPTPTFHELEWEEESRKGMWDLLGYLRPYRRLMGQLALGLFAGSMLQFIVPFLTQGMVDIGIQQQNISFIYLVLLAQVMLFIGKMVIEITRSWILLHVSTRLNISLISDFFIKLMRLPIGFFDSRITGDLLQRINDHRRIEQLLTNASLNTLFSLVNLLVFGTVLAIYSMPIFWVFVVGSACYLGWIAFFLKARKKIDHQRFAQISKEQSKVIELVNGMQEIKLHNAERSMRWAWEFIQVRLFKIAVRSLRLEQLQGVGAQFIDHLKNILISVLSATLVVSGEITLGMMLAIQYIIGQLNGPIGQLFGFITSVQDAQISLERLSEIHDKSDEWTGEETDGEQIHGQADIHLQDLAFRYDGSDQFVLDHLNLTIPAQKVTAIVGASGSGKTTLMKLLLKFYRQSEGSIKLGEQDFQWISPRQWRANCGSVMQEGYLFHDTVARNIAVDDTSIDKARLAHAVEMANIKSFIEQLPRSYNTKIGNEGLGLSTGQKQRILIARAIYRQPQYLFFDEATSALDSENERIIMENLQHFFRGRTVVVIAHRLSTVRNADQIVVLNQGKIVEQGTHDALLALEGSYFNLVKNQLQL
ncbi:peptidase domain-containing ABC transporter [Pontibacter sp. G13]|uniref:peptidase domain-containing ABC transporter n=1 Tax=Pontibacter sp. G13 TaxID=3074898 RepID=UPI00288B696F|nr:peptidase domain-containing ABC transporter [Pontibacter sp. G13]WNJ20365.1 peptidase domain-containing ABC transporter [Pontibacter sp. G13]